MALSMPRTLCCLTPAGFQGEGEDAVFYSCRNFCPIRHLHSRGSDHIDLTAEHFTGHNLSSTATETRGSSSSMSGTGPPCWSGGCGHHTHTQQKSQRPQGSGELAGVSRWGVALLGPGTVSAPPQPEPRHAGVISLLREAAPPSFPSQAGLGRRQP